MLHLLHYESLSRGYTSDFLLAVVMRFFLEIVASPARGENHTCSHPRASAAMATAKNRRKKNREKLNELNFSRQNRRLCRSCSHHRAPATRQFSEKIASPSQAKNRSCSRGFFLFRLFLKKRKSVLSESEVRRLQCQTFSERGEKTKSPVLSVWIFEFITKVLNSLQQRSRRKKNPCTHRTHRTHRTHLRKRFPNFPLMPFIFMVPKIRFLARFYFFSLIRRELHSTLTVVMKILSFSYS